MVSLTGLQVMIRPDIRSAFLGMFTDELVRRGVRLFYRFGTLYLRASRLETATELGI